MKIEASSLTKEQLIANIYRTDELIHEIDIIKSEIQKKEVSIQNYIKTEQEKYISEKLLEYKSSDEVIAYEQYEAWVEKVSQIKGIVILIDLIISVLLGDLLFLMGWKFLFVAVFWGVVPFILYYLYKVIMKQLIIKKQPKLPLSDKAMCQQIENTTEYQEIKNSMVVHYAVQEKGTLEQKIDSIILKLQEESVLKDMYWSKTRKLISYLENQMADNLKEALAVLSQDEHNEQVKQLIDHQNIEINQLQLKTETLVEENKKLAHLLAQQQEELSGLRSKK